MRKAEFQAIRDTILIVAFIKLHCPESAELWELIVLKTRDWVGRSLRDPGRTYGYGGGEARYSPLPVHLSRLRLIPFIDGGASYGPLRRVPSGSSGQLSRAQDCTATPQWARHFWRHMHPRFVGDFTTTDITMCKLCQQYRTL